MTRFGIFLCVITAVLGRTRDGRAGAFEVKDRDWEGCSELYDLARAELGEGRVLVLSQLDWGDLRPEDALFILHPDHAPSREKLVNFLTAGGRVALLDDFGAGAKLLAQKPFEIERVPAPTRPFTALRRNPELAIAEPVRGELEGHTASVHATVENVERLVTNHPTGLRNPKSTAVLQIRGIDEPDVILALAGNFGPGKLFAMGDPSALTNQMLRYPGNRAFAVGLLRYLAGARSDEIRHGRLLILANEFSETGNYGATDGWKGELDDHVESSLRELRQLLTGGFSGILGLACAALVALGISLWTTSVASRVYHRKFPSFARPVPMVAQGGAAGRVAVLASRTTPAALVLLELKSALEEGLAHELGFPGRVSPTQLLAEVRKSGGLDERGCRTLQSILLEMATVETLVAAGQPRRAKKSDVRRVARVVFELLGAVRRSSRERSAA